MKRIIIILFALLPILLNAGVIVKKSGERLDDVDIKSASGSSIIYITEKGTELSIPKSEVSAVLYDDGRYEEIQQISSRSQTNVIVNETTQSSFSADEKISPKGNYTPLEIVEGAKAYNVYAYGIYAGMGYFSKENNEGFTVEYRIIYKYQKNEPEFVYLGTTPFAYVTDKMAENSFVGRGNPYLMNIMEPKALVIHNDKDVNRIEFRLSKPGYKTTIVKPFKDIIIGCGPVLMISLDKIKPLKDGETNTESTIIEPSSENSDNVEHSKKTDSENSFNSQEESKKIIPQKCYNEASKVYKAVYNESLKRLLQQGYSKMQAYNIADDEARIAKQKILDECYETIAIKGEPYTAVVPVVSEEKPASNQKASKQAKKETPRECYAEGNRVYSSVHKEALNKALQLGYSNSQAYKIASDEALEAKKKAIEECTNQSANEQ